MPSVSSKYSMSQDVRYGHCSVRLIQDARRSQLKLIWLALNKRPKQEGVIEWRYTSKSIFHYSDLILSTLKDLMLTCDGHNVKQSPHCLGADVTEPVFSDEQFSEVEWHLTRDWSLHLSAPVSILRGDELG